MEPFLSPLLALANTLITRIFPDPEKRAAAQFELLKMQQEGELKTIETQMSAIIEEAKSSDKWTSRARPAFLYVMYIMILSSIPMGFLTAFNPEIGKSIAAGMKDWLASIPGAMWELFGAGYLGYVLSRSWDKTQILKGKLTK